MTTPFTEPTYTHIELGNEQFVVQTKAFIYSALKSLGYNKSADCFAEESRFIFSEAYLFNLIQAYKFEDADRYLSQFITPSEANFNVFAVLRYSMLVLATKNDKDVMKFAQMQLELDSKFKLERILKRGVPDIDMATMAEKIISSLRDNLATPKYSHLQRNCPPVDLNLLSLGKKAEKAPAQQFKEDEEDEEGSDLYDNIFGAATPPKEKEKTKRPRSPSTNGSSSNATVAKKPRTAEPQPIVHQAPKPEPVAPQRTEVPAKPVLTTPPPQTQSQPPVNPTPQPQLPRYPVTPITQVAQYWLSPVLQKDSPTRIKQLVSGFQGTCMTGIQDKDKLFFIYWSPISVDNKDITSLQVSRITNVLHPFVAITTTDSYFMNYGANQEGTLLKVARSTQQSVRNKAPKEIDIKVLLSDPAAPASLPTYAIFCPFDNNYVFAGFNSGNLAVGRVNNNQFQPFSIYKSNPATDGGEVCFIDCFSDQQAEKIVLAAALRGGTIKIISTDAHKKNAVLDIKVAGVESLAPIGKPDSVPPTCKFHPSGKLLLIKREKSLQLYQLDSSSMHTAEVDGIQFAQFSSGGGRVLALDDSSQAHVFKVTQNQLQHEVTFSIADIVNRGGAPSMVTVNPNSKDNTDFIIGTDRGYIVPIKLQFKQ